MLDCIWIQAQFIYGTDFIQSLGLGLMKDFATVKVAGAMYREAGAAQQVRAFPQFRTQDLVELQLIAERIDTLVAVKGIETAVLQDCGRDAESQYIIIIGLGDIVAFLAQSVKQILAIIIMVAKVAE